MWLPPAVALLVLGAPLALAGTSCLGHLDENHAWRPGFSCPPFAFCCGTCHRRFCCRDASLAISESQQRHCLRFSHKVIAGVASALILFVATAATALCCFFCTCRYLSRRRRRLLSPFAGPEIPLTGYLVQPVSLHPRGPGAPPPGVAGTPQHPLHPAALPPQVQPQPAFPGA
ncbi:protein shisa-4 [Pteronotus mesoamericanus]|uniref:protein shisa-4 n=1 Tax=Pteronotus mesoamericanus TaxID=1884717 RepID=UPI0023EE0EF0|nr:protein shisa-4 [Pteronotus parnellii mesoamericanus]